MAIFKKSITPEIPHGLGTEATAAVDSTGLATITSAEVGVELTVNVFAKDQNGEHVAHLFGDSKHTLKIDGYAEALAVPGLGGEVTFAGRKSVITKSSISASNEDFVKASLSGEGYEGTGAGTYAAVTTP